MKGRLYNVKWPQYHRHYLKAEHLRASHLLGKTHLTTGIANRNSVRGQCFIITIFFLLKFFLYGRQYVVVRTLYFTSLYLFIYLLNLFIPFYWQLGFPSDPNNS